MNKPHPHSFQAADLFVDMAFGIEGNPSRVTLDREQLRLLLAYAVDATIAACDRQWRDDEEPAH